MKRVDHLASATIFKMLTFFVALYEGACYSQDHDIDGIING